MASMDFAGSYEELIEKCESVADAMTRDLTELAAYNITAPVVSDFSDETEAFDLMPNDNLMESLQMTATAARNDKAKEVRAALGPIAKRILAVYGNHSGEYRAVGAGDTSRMSAEELKNICEDTVARFAVIPAPLATEGLTAPMIAAIGTLRTQIELAISAARAAVNNRSHAAEDKRRAANTLYAKLVKYCSYGKETWLGKDDAKYEDYVIYESSPAQTPPDAPEDFAVDAVTLLATWLAVAGATSYLIQIKYPANTGSWLTAATNITGTSHTLTSPGGNFKVRALARNSGGIGAASAEVSVNFGLAAPGGFVFDSVAGKFVWVMVAGVSFYRMEASYDGGVTWNEIFAANFTVGEYGWSPPAGQFRLRAESGAEVSEWVYTTIA